MEKCIQYYKRIVDTMRPCFLVLYFILLTSLYSTKYEWIWIGFTGSGFRGGGAASPKGKRIRLVLALKWCLLWMWQIWVLWTQLLDLLVQQSAQMSYRISRNTNWKGTALYNLPPHQGSLFCNKGKIYFQ